MPLQGRFKRILLSVLIGILSGTFIFILFPVGNPLIAISATSLLMAAAVYVLISVSLWAGNGKSLLWMVLLAFCLRLGFGIFSSLALPVYGYDEEIQKAGYLFFDAYTRDQQAWHFAESGRSLLLSFQNEFWTDQYGGLMGLSATVYRFLSPDAHRPLLILILGAFLYSLGIPFFWSALQHRWNGNIASLAAWILVLYPDGILFSGSQMREPFLIGLFCIAFWGVMHWEENRKHAAAAITISVSLMALISQLAAVAVTVGLFAWVWVAYYSIKIAKKWAILGWAVFGLIVITSAVLGYDWFHNAVRWDLLLTERSSGWVSKSIEEIGSKWRTPFMVGYGLVQPLLPAAIADDAITFWKTIGIFRSAGWYLLAPFLGTAPFLILNMPKSKDRRIYVLLTLLVYSWIMISSIRAGGDQWDNPRYRTIFLPLFALLVSWTFYQVRASLSPWLFRIIFVEIIFLSFFTNWYFSRYYLLWRRLPFWKNIAWIIGLSVIVILGGLAWDIFLKKKNKSYNITK